MWLCWVWSGRSFGSRIRAVWLSAEVESSGSSASLWGQQVFLSRCRHVSSLLTLCHLFRCTFRWTVRPSTMTTCVWPPPTSSDGSSRRNIMLYRYGNSWWRSPWKNTNGSMRQVFIMCHDLHIYIDDIISKSRLASFQNCTFKTSLCKCAALWLAACLSSLSV